MSAVITNGSNVETPDQAPSQPGKSSQSTLKLATIALCIALFAGGIGALISAAAFPAHNGKAGAAGPVGPKGPAGPAGSAASVSSVNVNTDKLGYCFNTNGGLDSNNDYRITSVTFTQPTDSNGAISCPYGQFISLTPQSPQGTPVSNYNAMVPAAGTQAGTAASTGNSSGGASSTATA